LIAFIVVAHSASLRAIRNPGLQRLDHGVTRAGDVGEGARGADIASGNGVQTHRELGDDSRRPSDPMNSRVAS